jgi:hypothetical protein
MSELYTYDCVISFDDTSECSTREDTMSVSVMAANDRDASIRSAKLLAEYVLGNRFDKADAIYISEYFNYGEAASMLYQLPYGPTLLFPEEKSEEFVVEYAKCMLTKYAHNYTTDVDETRAANDRMKELDDSGTGRWDRESYSFVDKDERKQNLRERSITLFCEFVEDNLELYFAKSVYVKRKEYDIVDMSRSGCDF